MDIASCLQCFENSLSSYAGEDPLDPWDKFVDYLEQRVPADSSGMSQVFESLVQRFLNVERYANDLRYVKHCIRCAGFYSDPLTLFSYVFDKGIGTRTAILYVAWAQLFEQRGANEQAEAVFHKAVENQAQPADTIISEYRQFQARTRSQTSAAGGRNPLQNSHMTNQISSHREPQSKVSTEAPPKPPTTKTIITISRSEMSGAISSSQGANVHAISEYLTDVLVCEGSELCFEEVRAEKYFRKLREKQERERQEQVFRQQEEEILSIRNSLEILNQELQACGGLSSLPSSHRSAVEQSVNITQQPSGWPRPSHRVSSRRSLGLRLHTEPTFLHEAAAGAAAIGIPEQPPRPQQSSVTNTHPSVLADRSVHLPKPTAAPGSTEETGDMRSSALQQEGHLQQENPPLQRWTPFDEGSSRAAELHAAVQQEVGEPPEAEDRLNMSQGGTGNLSHVTPNTSLGFVQATPSRVLPSPTVNTREALDVIMDMFQAPTLLEDPFGNTSALMAEREAEPAHLRAGGASSLSRPPPAAMFTVFQDDCDKENGSVSAPPPAEKSKPIRALAVNPVTSKPNDTPSDLMPDESTMWGTRYNSLNSLAACPNSTSDFAMLAQFVSTPFTHKTPLGGNFFPDKENIGDSGDVDDEAFTRRPLKKLSPIMEQSPLDETAISQLAPPSQRHGTILGEGLAAPPLCLTTSSTTMVQPPPPAMLSFRDQTVCPPDGSAHRAAIGPGCTSPEAPPRSESSAKTHREPFTTMEDLRQPASPERAPPPACDVPMSPDGALKPDWLNIGSPEVPAEPDLDAFLSPRHLRTGDAPTSPERPLYSTDVPMSPMDAVAMSPGKWPIADVSMNTATPAKAAGFKLVSNPWDDQLISELLSALTPPLTAHPRCITWQCNVPAITPKTTISMGNASLRVDCVLGQGAFATVYQATDPATSARMVLKVQKPANPWEFYINMQLDARMQPRLRHLYGRVSSAHLFHNGSVLLAELHNYGTLLNAVNIYKTLSDKLMPQPLVMYFAVCILNMVEQLHAIRIVHADVKPDNFMLGERFLENKCLEAENVDHGLVLIDLGQSIDMELFPQGTAFTVSCLTSGFQCTEMLSGKPWNYQTDYFGIAGTVHCMLFGTYMQVTNEGGAWKTNGVFRRNPHGDLWAEFFHTLLNVPDCNSPPDLQGLRHKLASVLQRDYGSKLAALKSRLVVQLLESRRAARR